MLAFQTKRAVNSILRRAGYRLESISSNGTDRSQLLEQEWRAPAAHASLLADWPVRTVIDVGANIGSTVKQYRHFFPEATIHAFEPSPEWSELLHSQFDDDPKVVLVSSAVGAEEGFADLNISVGPKMHSLLRRPDRNDIRSNPRAAIREVVSVPLTTIDNYVAQSQIGRIDLMKIDTEGAERLVLQGASQSLEEGRIVAIGIEIRVVESFSGEALFGEIYDILRAAGFSLFDIPYISRDAPGDRQFSFADATFLHDKYAKELA